MESLSSTFIIDTKGSCFLCYKGCSSGQTGPVSACSFKKISRYINVNFRKVFNISEPSQLSILLEDSDLIVTLCTGCGDRIDQCCKLYEELDLIQMKVKTCVQNLHSLMISAQTSNAAKEYHENSVTANPVEQVKAAVTENLRKETIQKCLSVIADPLRIKVHGKDSSNSNSPTKPNGIKTHELNISSLSDSNVSSCSSETDALKGMFWQYFGTGPGFGQEEHHENLNQDMDTEDTDNLQIVKVNSISSGFENAYPDSNMQNGTAAGTSVPRPQPQPSTSYADSLSGISLDKDIAALIGLEYLVAGIDNDPRTNKTFEDALQLPDGRYQCSVCGKIVANGHSFEAHRRIHTGEKPFQCIHCKQSFRNPSNLKVHTIKYHRAQLFLNFKDANTSLEEFELLLKGFLEDIPKQSDGIRQYFICTYCNKRCRQRLDIEAHIILVHYDDLASKLKNYKQQMPSVTVPVALPSSTQLTVTSMPSTRSLSPSIHTTRSLPYSIHSTRSLPPSAPSITSIRSLPPSIPSISSTRSLPPSIPSISSTRSLPPSISSTRSLVSSIPTTRLHHSHPSAKFITKTNGNGSATCTCNICGINLTSQLRLERHMKFVHMELPPRPSKIQHCAKKSTNNLPRIRLKCNICGKFFGDINSLKKHKLLHNVSNSNGCNNETAFSCVHCGKRFRFYHSHRVHLLTFHKLQVFSKYLPVGTTSKELDDSIEALLERYRRLPNDVCGCAYCTKEFSQRSDLRNHVLVAHFDEAVLKLKRIISQVKLSKSRRASVDFLNVENSGAKNVKVEDTEEIQLIVPDDPLN